MPITKLGAVTFKCRDVVEFEPEEEDRSWKDHVRDFYEEYDIIIWIGGGLLFLLIVLCLACCCWVRCKRQEVKRLQLQTASMEKQKYIDKQ